MAVNVVDHPVFGPTAPKLGWVPAPRYWLRRRRILRLLQDLPRGTLLEYGCGAGALLRELSSLGFDVRALESSEAARMLARTLNNDAEGRRIRSEPAEDWPQQFDVVMAFEVLEHIEDDVGALRMWRERISPGGRLILSVPAHQALWNRSDEWAGHFRRYGRTSLVTALKAAGFEVTHLEFYGYPVANLTERLRVRLAQHPTGDMAAGTAQSGIARQTESRLWPLMANPVSTLGFIGADMVQHLFLKTELGNGILALARPL